MSPSNIHEPLNSRPLTSAAPPLKTADSFASQDAPLTRVHSAAKFEYSLEK